MERFISKKEVLEILGNRLQKPDTWGNKVMLRELIESIDKIESIDPQEEINYAMSQYEK